MITLKYNSFMAYPFVQSFQKLSSQSFGMQTAYKIKLIGEKLMKQREKVQGEYRELVEKYATRDERGEMVHPDPKDTNGFDVKPELMEEYKAAETAFGLREFTVNVSQLTVKELEKCEFTPAELSQLDALIAHPPQAEEPIANVVPIKSEPIPDSTANGGI